MNFCENKKKRFYTTLRENKMKMQQATCTNFKGTNFKEWYRPVQLLRSNEYHTNTNLFVGYSFNANAQVEIHSLSCWFRIKTIIWVAQMCHSLMKIYIFIFFPVDPSYYPVLQDRRRYISMKIYSLSIKKFYIN